MFSQTSRICRTVLQRHYHTARSVHAIRSFSSCWVKLPGSPYAHLNAPFTQHRVYESTSNTTTTAEWKKLKNEDWAERLSPEAYFCTREGGTEPPFSGQYVTHKAEGVYKCVCCGNDLFTSKSKYDSGSGWPSFHSPAEENKVIRRKDVSHGMVRIEILCANCNSHLGHVFDDGPKETGERFCVNSVCLKFAPKKIN